MAQTNDWLSSNANELRMFLGNSTGRKLLDYAKSNTPVIISKDMEAVALEAYQKQGWEKCLEFILKMTDPPVGGDDYGVDHVDIENEPD